MCVSNELKSTSKTHIDFMPYCFGNAIPRLANCVVHCLVCADLIISFKINIFSLINNRYYFNKSFINIHIRFSLSLTVNSIATAPCSFPSHLFASMSLGLVFFSFFFMCSLKLVFITHLKFTCFLLYGPVWLCCLFLCHKTFFINYLSTLISALISKF